MDSGEQSIWVEALQQMFVGRVVGIRLRLINLLSFFLLVDENNRAGSLERPVGTRVIYDSCR